MGPFISPREARTLAKPVQNSGTQSPEASARDLNLPRSVGVYLAEPPALTLDESLADASADDLAGIPIDMSIRCDIFKYLRSND
jgi:hypothetical protein